jgi:hypothetical protein
MASNRGDGRRELMWPQPDAHHAFILLPYGSRVPTRRTSEHCQEASNLDNRQF